MSVYIHQIIQGVLRTGSYFPLECHSVSSRSNPSESVAPAARSDWR